jgi:hypothetical protein
MKKKYSDPLMFSSVLLSGIPINKSGEGTQAPDEEWSDSSSGACLMLNSAPAQEAADPLTIVNPVEEAVTAPEGVQEELPAEDPAAASPLEVAPVIDSLVPEDTSEPAPAGE